MCNIKSLRTESTAQSRLVTSKLTIATLGAILVHVAAGVGFSFFPRDIPQQPPPSEDLSKHAESEFMTVPEQAELLLTPSVATAPSIEKPAQEIPLPPAEATQSPHAQPSKDVVQDTERQKAEREQKRLAEADRLRALRLQQADQALAEARRLDASRETARPSNPPRPKIRASKLPNTKPAARSKPQSAPAPIHTKAKGETRGPMTVRQSPPRYPRNLERKGIGGKVSVLINIDSKGRVSSASVNRSSGHKELDKAATAAVKRWRFKPALKDGEKSASKTAVDIVFQPKS